jgi:hypothetical protein
MDPSEGPRSSTDLIGYTRGRLERAVAAGDAAGAPLDLASLRRDIAHAAAALAAIRTHTPAPRVSAAGDPASGDDVLQVRIGDTIYRHWPVISPHMEDHSTGPSGQRCTWDELPEMGGGALTEIPAKGSSFPGATTTRTGSSVLPAMTLKWPLVTAFLPTRMPRVQPGCRLRQPARVR